MMASPMLSNETLFLLSQLNQKTGGGAFRVERGDEAPLLGVEDLSLRAERAAKIAANARNFKVCEGCDSIVAERVGICPNCYGYRFTGDEHAVIAQAQLLASREQATVTAQDLL